MRVGYTTDEDVGRFMKYHKFASAYGWTVEEIDRLPWDVQEILEVFIDEEAKKIEAISHG